MNSNEKQYYIYIRSGDQRILVSKETFDSYYRSVHVYRRQRQRDGECACPQSKRLFCDTDCDNCPFRVYTETRSLDDAVIDNDGNRIPLLHTFADDSPRPEEIMINADETQRLYERLIELVPEAIEIGRLRLAGLSEDAIGERIGIGRKTYAYRLKKAKSILAEEFPDVFLKKF